MVVITSSDVNAWDDALATDYNKLRADVLNNAADALTTAVPFLLAWMRTSESNPVITTTTALIGLHSLSTRIIVNKITFSIISHSVNWTFDFWIYSEDGQTLLISGTSATVTAPNQTQTITLWSPVTLPRWNYYIAAVLNSWIFRLTWYRNASSIGALFSPAWLPQLEWTLTVTAWTLPATFDPATDITFVLDSNTVVRLDN